MTDADNALIALDRIYKFGDDYAHPDDDYDLIRTYITSTAGQGGDATSFQNTSYRAAREWLEFPLGKHDIGYWLDVHIEPIKAALDLALQPHPPQPDTTGQGGDAGKIETKLIEQAARLATGGLSLSSDQSDWPVKVPASVLHQMEKQDNSLRGLAVMLKNQADAIRALQPHPPQPDKCEGLLAALQAAQDECVEINTSNYDHDDVCQLNAGSIAVFKIIYEALAKYKETT